MIDLPLLRRQIEEALAQPKSADREVAVRRQLGLRLVITTRDEQSAADVQTAIERFSTRFTVEPLFPAPAFEVAGPGAVRHWSDSVFLAMVYGVAFADVTENAWDLAREVQRAGGFVNVAPEFPMTMTPAADQEEAGSADEPGESWGWERKAMHIDEAWEVIRSRNRAPGSNVTIGHPDCGYREHEIWTLGRNLDRSRGRSFWPGENPNDATEKPGGEYPGHGLATASVMVALHQLQQGTVSGVAPGSLLLPIRCNDTVIIYAITTESLVARAVRYAMEQQCRVISISMGGLYEWFGPHPLGLLYQTIQEAINADIIVVAAAGQSIPFYPTVIPAEGRRVIGVAGIEKTTRRYQAWGHSCRAPYGSVTVSAPARTVTRASADGGYSTSEGTSYAAAFVAGVAALWLSHHYHLGYPRNSRLRAAECFRNHLLEARWVPDGFDSWFGGIIDAHRLIVTDPKPNAEPKDENRGASSLVGLLSGAIDPEDPGQFEKLVLEVLRSGLPAPQDEGTPSEEQLVIEIGSILGRSPGALAEIARLKNAGTLSAPNLATLLAPQASKALRGRLAEH